MWVLIPFFFLIGIGTALYLLYVFVIKRPRVNNTTSTAATTLKIPQNLLFAVLLLILSFNIFVYNAHFGIGIGLFVTLSAFAAYYTFPVEQRTPLVQVLLFGITVTSMFIGFRANGFVQGVNLAVSAIFFIVIIGLHAANNIQWHGLWLLSHFKNIVLFCFANIPKLVHNSTQQVQETEDQSINKTPVIQIIKISILTFVLVLLFAALLSAADPIFADLIQNLLDQAFGRIVLSILIAVIAITLLTVDATERSNEYRPQFHWFSFWEIVIPISALVVVFSLFLFIQAKYLFGAHIDLANFGLTFSQYVRQGFAELLITTLIGGLLVYGIYLKQSVTDNKNHILGYKILSSVVIAQLFLMLISALKRDLLYVELFGITRTRIIGGVFILCLAVFFMSLLLLILMERMKERHLFLVLAGISAFVVASHNFVNVDEIIARAPAPAQSYKDYFYINSLSEDAYFGWKESIPSILSFYENVYIKASPSEADIEQFTNYKLALLALQEKRDTLMNKYSQTNDSISSGFSTEFNERERALGAFNFSEFRAFMQMANQRELFFDTVNCLVTEMERYQRYYRIDTYTLEAERLYQYDYPFVNAQRGYYPKDLIGSETNGTFRTPPSSCIE